MRRLRTSARLREFVVRAACAGTCRSASWCTAPRSRCARSTATCAPPRPRRSRSSCSRWPTAWRPAGPRTSPVGHRPPPGAGARGDGRALPPRRPRAAAPPGGRRRAGATRSGAPPARGWRRCSTRCARGRWWACCAPANRRCASSGAGGWVSSTRALTKSIMRKTQPIRRQGCDLPAPSVGSPMCPEGPVDVSPTREDDGCGESAIAGLGAAAPGLCAAAVPAPRCRRRRPARPPCRPPTRSVSARPDQRPAPRRARAEGRPAGGAAAARARAKSLAMAGGGALLALGRHEVGRGPARRRRTSPWPRPPAIAFRRHAQQPRRTGATCSPRRWRFGGVGAARDCNGLIYFTVNFLAAG